MLSLAVAMAVAANLSSLNLDGAGRAPGDQGFTGINPNTRGGKRA